MVEPSARKEVREAATARDRNPSRAALRKVSAELVSAGADVDLWERPLVARALWEQLASRRAQVRP